MSSRPTSKEGKKDKKGKKGAKDETPEEEVVVIPDAGTGRLYFRRPNGEPIVYDGEWQRFAAVPQNEETAQEEEKKEAKGKKGGKKDAKNAVEEVPKVIKRHGQGKMFDGHDTYEGQWCEDEMHGRGRMTYASGSYYEGEWVHNVYQGVGKYEWPDGTYYIGEFYNNKIHGEGAYVDARGIKWQGHFSNGSGPGLIQSLS